MDGKRWKKYLNIGKSKKHGSTSTPNPSQPPTSESVDPVYKHYARIFDGDTHASDGQTPIINGNKYEFRGNWAGPMKLYKLIGENKPTIKEFIDGAGVLSNIFSRVMSNSDQCIATEMIERWWNTMHTFQFPFVEIAFMPMDFTMLSGII